MIIPEFIILKQFSLLDTYPVGVLPLVADAFGIFLMKQFFQSIPGEIEEAARIDGASPFQSFALSLGHYFYHFPTLLYRKPGVYWR